MILTPAGLEISAVYLIRVAIIISDDKCWRNQDVTGKDKSKISYKIHMLSNGIKSMSEVHRSTCTLNSLCNSSLCNKKEPGGIETKNTLYEDDNQKTQ